MSTGDQQLMGLLQKAQLNSGLQNDPSNARQITIKDSQVDRLMVGMVLDLQGIKTLVIKYQNIDKGFYLYEDWVKLHDIIFEAKHDSIIQMWRILKLINFGDDFVPTGLVFDTLVTLFNVEAETQDSEVVLKRLFYRFIELNGKMLTQKEKEEIEFLKILRRIVEGYRDMIRQKLTEGEVVSPRQDKKRYQSLHQLHGLYTYKRNLKKMKKIDDELKDCTFEPELFESRKHVQSRYLASTNKTYQQPLQEQELFQTKIFRATPIPQYPQRYPKGYTPHITRLKQHTQSQHQRSLSKPIVIPPKTEQFSIERRDQQRKFNSLKNRPVLFLIQAQVGKRRFWIKVREGMTEEQVVKQIELLAGFEDKEIPAVVEQYFMNYFKKTHQIEI